MTAGRGRRPVVLIEAPASELLSRIVRLELACGRAAAPEARAEALEALAGLVAARDGALPALPELDALTDALREVESDLAAVRDDLRACEAVQSFGPGFIALARALSPLEDRRAELLAEIDVMLGARLTAGPPDRRA